MSAASDAPKRGRFSSLGPRVLVAVLFVPVLIWTGIQAGWGIWLLINGAFLVAVHEWSNLFRAQGRRVHTLTQGVGILLVLNSGFCAAESALPLAAALAVILISIERVLRAPTDGVTADLGAALAGVLYVGVLGSFIPRFLLIPTPNEYFNHYISVGSASFFIFFLMTFAADTFAYFAGLLLGRHPLFPRVSPKKSVEGLVGGALGAALVGWIAALTFAPFLHSWDGLGLGAAVAVIGQLGDLVESSLKRDAGVKDASSVLPGHGGVLDRLDSLLFAAPVAYAYIRFVVL